MSRVSKWLFAIAALTLSIAVVILVVSRANRLDVEARAKEHQLRNEKEFEKVKGGSKDVLIFSPDLIAMLAGDSDCVGNVETVELFGDDLKKSGYGQIQRLVNIRNIFFDECEGVESILPRLNQMPRVEYLYFHDVAITEEIQLQLASIPTLKRIRFGSLGQEQLASLARKVPNIVVEVFDTLGQPIRVSNGSH